MRLARPSTVWIASAVAALTLSCHGGALLRGGQYAHRDASHYYYPLHLRVQQEWASGRWPLWDPSENGGMPLMGNPTAAVLYPGKLIFAAFAYPLASRLYVVAHTLLAFGAMLALLRSWGTSGVGSGLGGLAYAFGAPVLFQYCNIIFLVGAAWAPLGMLAADRWVRLGDRRAIPGLGAVLAMETLGGDPEAAYLTGVFAAAHAAWLSIRQAWGGRARIRRSLPVVIFALAATWVGATLVVAAHASRWRPSAVEGVVPALPWMRWVGPGVTVGWAVAGGWVSLRWLAAARAGRRSSLAPTLAGLVASAALAVGLSAAQLLPGLEFAGQSARVLGEPGYELQSFSLDPARLIEFAWPNAGGTIFDGNHSWIEAAKPIGKAAKPWVPSLYLGGLTLVLALVAIRAPGGPTGLGWVVAVGIFSLAASFGEFASPVCLARRSSWLASMIGAHDPPDDPAIRLDGRLRDGDGSLYWALATFLPGFGTFRFPSKLLTFTAIALAALAARGWDALASGDAGARRRAIAWSGGWLGVTLVALVGASIGARGYFDRLDRASRLSLGPLDVEAAVRDLRGALIQGGLVFGLVLAMAAGRAWRGRFAGGLALSVMAIDLGLANSGLVLTVPQRLFEERPEVLAIIDRAEREHPSEGPYRVHRMPKWEPPGWSRVSTVDRAREFLAWERGTLQPKHGIPLGVQYTMTFGAAELRDHRAFFGRYLGPVSATTERMLGVPPGLAVIIHPRVAFDLWNTRYFVLPFYANNWTDKDRGFAAFLDRTEPLHPTLDAFRGDEGPRKRREWIESADFQVRRNLASHPRAWVVHRGVEFRAGPGSVDEILFPEGDPLGDPTRPALDPRAVVRLERGRREPLRPFLDGRSPGRGESARVSDYRSDRVEIRAKLDRPGLVVLADVHYPGWSLTIDGQPAPIERANRLMRAAAVPSGEHALVYTYRPASFRCGLILTGSTIGGWLLLGAWTIRRRRLMGRDR